MRKTGIYDSKVKRRLFLAIGNASEIRRVSMNPVIPRTMRAVKASSTTF